MPSTATDRLAGLTTSVAVKAPCKVASTTALTLSGEQTIGGVSCVDGDRVLYALAAGSVSNGIWVVSTGAWSRAKDFDGARDVVQGTLVSVLNGDVQFYEVLTSGTISPGTTSISFTASTLGATVNDAAVVVQRAETGAVETSAHAINASTRLNIVSHFGASKDNTNTATTTAALTAALAAAVVIGNAVVEIPDGSYSLTAGTNLAAAGVAIEGMGRPVLNFVGSGIAAKFDAGGSSGTVCYGTRLTNVILKGNAGTTVGFYSKGMVHMTMRDVEVKECSTIAFQILHGVSNQYDSCAYTTNRGAQTTTPGVGWSLNENGAGYYTANCTFVNCIAEGFTGVGLSIDSARGNVFIGGTFEGITGKGIEITNDTCSDNHFINVWCEANTVNDLIVKGVGNLFTGCRFQSSSSGNTVDITTGTGTRFFGGYARLVNLGASSSGTHFEAVRFSDNGSLGIQGSGTHTRQGCKRSDTSDIITTSYVDILGPSGTWTPTITQSAGVAATINSASYIVSGQMVHLVAKLTITAAGSAGSEIVIGGIPSTIAIAADLVTHNIPIGYATYADASVGNYVGNCHAVTSQTFNVRCHAETSTLGIDPNFATANTDTLTLNLFYPLAV